MTVGVVIRVPGLGAVLACDSRVSGDSGSIMTDTDQKWGEFGSVVAVCAGALGGLWIDLKDSPPRNWKEFRERITDLDANDHDRSYEIMVYDRAKDRVIHTDHQGDALMPGNYGVIGCGGPLALGVLDAVKPPSTLEAAAKLAHRAVKIACRRNAFCGGRVRTILVRGRKGRPEVR